MVEAIVKEILASHTLEIDQFVFMGSSAGAYGVANNCDAVADLVIGVNGYYKRIL